MILIRKAGLKDVASIHKLLDHDNGIEENIANFMVCEVDGLVCGCGCSSISETECFIGNVSVAESYRNNGYGSTIVKALLNSADLRGIKEAYAVGDCRNFFIKLRFEEAAGNTSILSEKFNELFGKAGLQGIYHVSLNNYFTKSCKGTC